MKKVIYVFMITIFVIVFSGCVPLMQESSQLSYSQKSNSYIDVSKEEKSIQSKQNAIHSLSGMLNIPKLGFTYFNTKDRNPLYLVGYSSTKSFYITQTMQNKDVTDNVLKDIRDDIIKLKELSYHLIKDKIEKIEINPLTKKLIINNFDSGEFDKKYNEIAKKLEHHGLFLVYWDGKEKRSNDTKTAIISSENSLESHKNSNDSGFMILSGLKFSTLYISDEIIKEWEKIDTKIKETSETYPRIVTSTIQAKDIYYFVQESFEMELSELIDIKMSKLISDLPSLSQTDIKKLLISSISYENTKFINRLKDINSMGITSNMKKEVYPLFYDDASIENIKAFVGGQDKWTGDDSSLWQTIYSVDTDIFEIKKWLVSKLHEQKNN